MIKYVDGDLLDFTEWDAIAHCCNCQNTFGSGIAKQIKDRYPIAYQMDCLCFERGTNKLGSFARVKVGEKDIYNIYGQEFYGREKRHLDYEAIYCGLERVRNDMSASRGVYRLGVPYKMGCDRAGGEWMIVEAMLKYLFEDSTVLTLVIVKYNK